MMMSYIYAGYGSGTFVLVLVAVMVVRLIVTRSRRGQGMGTGSAFGPRRYRPPYAPGAPPPPSGAPVAPGGAAGAGHGIAPGWLPDPSGRFDLRYWSGAAWTEHVTKGGVPSTDPPPGTGHSGPAADGG
jgi:hypothetical protein